MCVKRLVLIIVVVAVALCGLMAIVATTQAAAPPESPATDIADGIISDLWPVIMDKQVAYNASNGSFFQGLPTHTTVPTGGISMTLDMQYSHPTDQSATWVDFFGAELPDELPFLLVCHSHETPTNSGFTCYFDLMEGATLYRRAEGFGGASQNYAWRSLPTGP